MTDIRARIDLCGTCGGEICKYCSHPKNSKSLVKEQAIPGIYSSWITDSILAMARPCFHLMDEINLIQNLKESGIRTVINMQKTGEHSLCGKGILPSGYSYDPNDFMREVYYYNFQWNDFGVAGPEDILNIMQVFKFSLMQGKVAVHCHAGLGRTGTVIGCFLIYDRRISGQDAIDIVRSKRPRSIQTNVQVATVMNFKDFLEPYRVHFPLVLQKSSTIAPFTIYEYQIRQSKVLIDMDIRRFKYFPKLKKAKRLNLTLKSTGSEFELDCDSVSNYSLDSTQMTVQTEVEIGSQPEIVSPISAKLDSNSHETSKEPNDIDLSCLFKDIESYVYSAEQDLAFKMQLNDSNEWVDEVIDNIRCASLLLRLVLDWYHELKTPLVQIQALFDVDFDNILDDQLVLKFDYFVQTTLSVFSRFIGILRNYDSKCTFEPILIDKIASALLQMSSPEDHLTFPSPSNEGKGSYDSIQTPILNGKDVLNKILMRLINLN